jgi:hypothetical protein
MHREISDAELLTMLNEVESEDSTVEEIIREIELWFPDKATENIILFKHLWNHLHRLLLVLESDCHIQSDVFRKANLPCQMASAVVLAGLVGSYFAFGFGLPFILVWVGCGYAGNVILMHTIMGGNEWLLDENYNPFASKEEMLAVARRVSTFSMTPPPPDMPEYVPPSKFSVPLTPINVIFVICAPLVLGVLMFPIIGWARNSRVVTRP